MVASELHAHRTIELNDYKKKTIIAEAFASTVADFQKKKNDYEINFHVFFMQLNARLQGAGFQSALLNRPKESNQIPIQNNQLPFEANEKFWFRKHFVLCHKYGTNRNILIMAS